MDGSEQSNTSVRARKEDVTDPFTWLLLPTHQHATQRVGNFFPEKHAPTQVLCRLKKARGTSTQGRLDNFFTKIPASGDASKKRPAEKDAGGKGKKAKPGTAAAMKKKK